MEEIVILLGACSVVYAVVAFSKTIKDDYRMHKAMVASNPLVTNASYADMLERLRPVEEDVRPNSGHPLDEKEYLERADKMNADTKIFDWINSQTKQYEW